MTKPKFSKPIRSCLALTNAVILWIGYILGLIFHCLHDGWRLARHHVDNLHDECIDHGWYGEKT